MTEQLPSGWSADSEHPELLYFRSDGACVLNRLKPSAISQPRLAISHTRRPWYAATKDGQLLRNEIRVRSFSSAILAMDAFDVAYPLAQSKPLPIF